MIKQAQDKERARELAREIYTRATRRKRGTDERPYLIADLGFIEGRAHELVVLLDRLLPSEEV